LSIFREVFVADESCGTEGRCLKFVIVRRFSGLKTLLKYMPFFISIGIDSDMLFLSSGRYKVVAIKVRRDTVTGAG